MPKRTETETETHAVEAAIHNSDTENAHGDADDALCDLLCALGYQDVIEAYHKVAKWYA